MPRLLLLARHAKSRWPEGVPDHERPLARRGKDDALRMGAELRRQGLVPNLIVCSTAKRARSTTRRVVEASGYVGDVRFSVALFDQELPAFINLLRSLPDSATTVMIVGHNPLMEEAVALLTGRVTPLPTMAVACIEIPQPSWSEIPAGGATLRRLILPSELASLPDS